jgi:hypothetical protein
MAAACIGSIPFVDGVTRDVFLDAEGRQYVIDGKDPVYGVWILLDEPEIIEGTRESGATR